MISMSEFQGYFNPNLETTFTTEAGAWSFPGSRSFFQPSSFHKVNDFCSAKQIDEQEALACNFSLTESLQISESC